MTRRPLLALLFLLLLAPAGALVAFSPSQQASVEISPRAMQHIMTRHGPESQAPDAGKFASGSTEAAIRDLIAQAVRQGIAHADSNGRPATLYDFSFADSIGVTADGRPTRSLRVVVSPEGGVITAYPR